MKEVPKFYTTMFNAATDALRELEKQNAGSAKDLLIRGQLRAEGECTAWMEEQRE